VTVRPTTRPTALTFRASWRPVTPSTNVRSRCATRSPSTLRVYTRLTYLFLRRQIRGERSKLPPDQLQRELVEPRPLLLQLATSASTSSPRLAIEDQPESGVKIMRAARAPRPSPARWVLHVQGRPGGLRWSPRGNGWTCCRPTGGVAPTVVPRRWGHHVEDSAPGRRGRLVHQHDLPRTVSRSACTATTRSASAARWTPVRRGLGRRRFCHHATLPVTNDLARPRLEC
jgi:hypothetical protein